MKHLYLLLTAMMLTSMMYAQVPGTTSTVTKSFSFQESLQNVQLDPSPTVGDASKVQFLHTFKSNRQPEIGLNTAKNILGANGITIPSWLEDLAGGTGFFCSGITPSFSVGASVDVGGYYMVRAVGNSDIDIDYPVEVLVKYPQQNTFACGDIVKIETSYHILEPHKSDKLKVKTPFINQEIGPEIRDLRFDASFGIDAWVGFGISVPYPCLSDGVPDVCYYTKCGNKKSFNQSKSFNLGFPTPSMPAFLNICENAFGPGANEASLLSCKMPWATPILNLGQSLLNTYNHTYGTNFTFASFPDPNTVKVFTPDLPPNGPTLPEMEGTFKDSYRYGRGSRSQC